MTGMSWAFLVDSVPFTREVINGETSLGGSESACLGLARALKARGHDVHLFVTKLADDAHGRDRHGVTWHDLRAFPQMNQFIYWDVVVGLRMYPFFAGPIHARLRVLWNQDLLPAKQNSHVAGSGGMNVMAVSWNLDKSVYVSEYHRRQWEELVPEIDGIGAVTKNGYDPAFVQAGITKDPNRIIHISRPERGLSPLMHMWPEMRKRNPQATLQLCRYSSMYDKDHWGKICLAYDEWVEEVNSRVGGIEWLGELNKPDLYRAIATSAVMWYPGVASFAETSCIAAIEAQANGTPFVGSLRGALPETARPSYDAGLLIAGDAEKEITYQDASIAAVQRMMDGCAKQTREYREIQQAGYAHVKPYTYATIATEWERQVGEWFAERYEANKIGILRQLMHEEDRTAAKVVARDILAENHALDSDLSACKKCDEATAAIDLCDRIAKGLTCGPDIYAKHALENPLREIELSGRFRAVCERFADRTRVLDIACGNGAGTLALALSRPGMHLVGVDYSDINIARAKAAAIEAGVADRCTFLCGPVWDFATGTPAESFPALIDGLGPFDGLFVGEFIEHVEDCSRLVDWLEGFCEEGAQMVYTCPSGPFIELADRAMPLQYTHVHHFRHDDIRHVFGNKADLHAEYLAVGSTRRGVPVGHWLIEYVAKPGRQALPRDQATVAMRTRPMRWLSVGIIAKDAAGELGKCLASVWDIADEIVVGDTGSTDGTKAIAEDYGARVLDLPQIDDHREGFSGARNAVLEACKGDWFLWIDTDEVLTASQRVRKYLDGEIYRGFVLHQLHLMVDAAPHYDKPIRLFKNDGRIKFYGCIHEQPQQDDCNGEIVPAFDMSSENRMEGEPLIAHTGYLTEGVRKVKMHSRNLPLLVRDQEVFPDRRLGKVLIMRDYVTLSDEDANRAGEMTEKAQAGYAHAVRIFIEHFDKPEDTFHAIARPYYETAIQRLGKGTEVEVAIAGKFGGLKDRHAKPSKLWVRDMDEFERYLNWKVHDISLPLREVPFKTEPFVLPAQQVGA